MIYVFQLLYNGEWGLAIQYKYASAPAVRHRCCVMFNYNSCIDGKLNLIFICKVICIKNGKYITFFERTIKELSLSHAFFIAPHFSAHFYKFPLLKDFYYREFLYLTQQNLNLILTWAVYMSFFLFLI